MGRWLGRLFAGYAARSTPPSAPPVVGPDAPPAVVIQAPEDAEFHRLQGNRMLDAGRLDDAAACYKSALVLDPDCVPALVNLGFVSLEAGSHEPANEYLLRVLQLDPYHADALYMLGRSCLARGDAQAAATHLQTLIDKQPEFGLAYVDLCGALLLLGRRDEALALAEVGLIRDPNRVQLHLIQGNIHLESRRYEVAIASYELALALHPDLAETHANLGAALAGAGRTADACLRLRRALALRPTTATGCEHLGSALQRLGLLDESIAAYDLAVQMEPTLAAAHRNMGIALQAAGRLEKARDSFQCVADLRPLSAQALTELGLSLQALDQTTQAMASLRRAQALEPEYAPAHAGLGTILVQEGDTAAALPHFDRALLLDPGYVEAHSNRLFALSFNADPPTYLLAAHDYGRKVSLRAQPFSSWTVESLAATGGLARMKVGLVSGDLRAHPVGFFIESVLQHLCNLSFDIVGIPTSHQSDGVTRRLQSLCAEWLPLAGMADDTAARTVRAAGIHILIDLAGHTAHNRLPVFAWRPAPVQISWLGYFASTGIDTMDYLLADPVSVPDSARAHFSEPVWWLPRTRLCFTEPGPRDRFPVSVLPATVNGWITLGSYQNLNKLNPGVLEVWRRVLEALPQARLRLQNKQTGQPKQRAAVMARLQAAGLDVTRVDLAPPAPRDRYLSSYREVDFLLDTFPYPGGTTTCEALWMGVPTLTLAGQSMLSRQGEALIGCAGLHDWVARDEADFVRRAVAHSNDLHVLARCRAELRHRVLASALFDAPAFAQDLAQALKAMWGQRKLGR